MKTIYTLAIIFALLSLSQCGAFDFIGNYISLILRADILDIIDCILHNDLIIKDVNVIIDALLTKDFYKIIAALSKVANELIDAIKVCINNPPPKPF